MILFEEDWAYYPTARPHLTTKNKSWLEYCRLLEKMGVRNYYSPLALIDQSLEFVDPFDPYLTIDTIQRILAECANNPWYFLRELVRVPAKASPVPGRLEANRGNIALYFLALNDIDVGITQIRQTGKTLNCNILLAYMLLIKCVNTTMQLMTRSNRLRMENVSSIKEIRELLPKYVANIDRKDADNSEVVTCVRSNNKILTALPANSEKDAIGAGRGFTSPIIMIDESAFCSNIDGSYPSMMSSTDAASDEARRAGVPTFRLFPCTAGDKGSKEGKFMHDVYNRAARWQEQFFDCKDKEDLQETIRTNSKNRRLMCYIEFNHRQLGRTDEWLYEKIVASEGDADEVNRDYFNQWTSGTGSSPLEREVREAISKSEQDPSWIETSENRYMLRWYIDKKDLENRIHRKVKFVAGLDASEGLGRDQMTLVMIDEETLETIASLSVSDVVNTIHFSDYICKLMLKYKNIVLIPERRSSGTTIIDSLLIQLPIAGEDPFERIFNRVVNDGDVPNHIKEFANQPAGRRNPRMYEQCKAYFGYATSGGGLYSRDNLYKLTLTRMSNYASGVVKDKALIGELMSLVMKNHRIDHASSGHDDNVISWLLAGWLLNFGKNLSMYGITNPLLKVVSYKDRTRNKTETRVERFNRGVQDNVRTRLSYLIKRLSEAEGDMEAILIENKIRHMSSKLEDSNKLPNSVDELMKQANEIRRNRYVTSNYTRVA